MSNAPQVAPPTKHPFHFLDCFFIVAIATALVVVTLCVILPAALGLKGYAISSISMEPTLSRGDLIFVKPTQVSDVQAGAVIAFEQNGVPITHRVYSVNPATGELRTRGDAAAMLDPLPVTQEQLLGTVLYKIPLLGYFALSQGEVVS